MKNIIQTINEKKIEKKVSDSLTDENKKYLIDAINTIENKINTINGIICDDEVILNSDIASFSRSTSLNSIYDEKRLAFYYNDDGKENIAIVYKDGEFKYSHTVNFNNYCANIVDKYKDLLVQIATRYQKICPYLAERKELLKIKDIILGKDLYEAYVLESNVLRAIKKSKRKIDGNLTKIRGNVFDASGWYYVGDNMFAQNEKDVDRVFVNAVILDKNWRPYSVTKKCRDIEQNFIDKNMKLLNEYKVEYFGLEALEKRRNNASKIVKEEEDKRNKIVRMFIPKEKKESDRQL